MLNNPHKPFHNFSKKKKKKNNREQITKDVLHSPTDYLHQNRKITSALWTKEMNGEGETHCQNIYSKDIYLENKRPTSDERIFLQKDNIRKKRPNKKIIEWKGKYFGAIFYFIEG